MLFYGEFFGIGCGAQGLACRLHLICSRLLCNLQRLRETPQFAIWLLYSYQISFLPSYSLFGLLWSGARFQFLRVARIC